MMAEVMLTPVHAQTVGIASAAEAQRQEHAARTQTVTVFYPTVDRTGVKQSHYKMRDEPPTASLVEDACLLNHGLGIVTKSKCLIYPGMAHLMDVLDNIPEASRQSDGRYKLTIPAQVPHSNETVIAHISGSKFFGSNLIHAAALGCWAGKGRPLDGLPVVAGLCTRLTPFLQELYAKAGVGAERIRYMREPIARFSGVWMLGNPTSLTGSPMVMSSDMLGAFRRLLGVPQEGRGRRRIYLTRRDAPWRPILNDAEVSEFLSGYGFETVTATDLSVDEWLSLGKDVEVMISPFGSGFINATFLPDSAIVAEFLPQSYDVFPQHRDGGVSHISAQGQKYWRIIVDEEPEVGQIEFRHPLRVPLDVLKTAVEAILDGHVAKEAA